MTPSGKAIWISELGEEDYDPYWLLQPRKQRKNQISLFFLKIGNPCFRKIVEKYSVLTWTTVGETAAKKMVEKWSKKGQNLVKKRSKFSRKMVKK